MDINSLDANSRMQKGMNRRGYGTKQAQAVIQDRATGMPYAEIDRHQTWSIAQRCPSNLREGYSGRNGNCRTDALLQALRDKAGTDVAVSRGPAGEFMYDFEPMRHEAERQQRETPGAWVTFFCQRNGVAVAGFSGADDGPRIDIELGGGGYLTRPVRIWYSAPNTPTE